MPVTKPDRSAAKSTDRTREEAPDDIPPAGPHAEPALTNPDATPGAGALTPPGEHIDSDSTSG
jgi:hypothetical protein